jgi:hypothetical protein
MLFLQIGGGRGRAVECALRCASVLAATPALDLTFSHTLAKKRSNLLVFIYFVPVNIDSAHTGTTTPDTIAVPQYPYSPISAYA